eukprot:CAMPEP_0197555624 /NCGR_PEP_ID=MMETSP1320-20131121/13626_1 /TAXON_ID=91990 /ORGANISM="Bolidomonas sp., Strain RCC2347" /LENGTH=244 /DNA_ID=CAMNT_0043116657 /DNA_START=80 /DNA_END=811 /DNA_ORIENTATION=+
MTTPSPLSFPLPSYEKRRHTISNTLSPATVFVLPSVVAAARHQVLNPTSTTIMPDSEAQSIYRSCCHPQTGSVIPFPLRISWILPMNLFLTTLMMRAQHLQSGSGIVGSQLLNQTYNVLHYRALRNTDNVDSDAKVTASFVTAVAASCATSLRLSKVKSIGSAAPFLAVCVGTVANMTLMRSSEILEGVRVYTEDGRDMGKSRLAGATGVGVSILGRIMTAAPPMLLPQVGVEALKRSVPAYGR